MTRRDWIVALGSGLCASVLPGCMRHTVVNHDPSALVGRTESALGKGPAVALAPPVSPYHPFPVVGLAASATPTEAAIAQVSHMVPAASDRPSPRAIVLIGPDPEGLPAEPGPGAAGPAAKAADEPPLVAALRCFRDKRPAEAMRRLESYDKLNQDLLLCLLPLAVHLTEGNLNQADPKDVAIVVDQLQSLVVPLRPRAALVIDKMCLCRQIEKYGVYDPLPADPLFQPGDLVQVYVELRNFSSAHRDGGYVTCLASSAEIRDREEELVWRQEFNDQQRPDFSQTLRNDYFNNYRFRVPEVPPGAYTLWIQVVDMSDQGRQRTVRRALDFRVAARSPFGGGGS